MDNDEKTLEKLTEKEQLFVYLYTTSTNFNATKAHELARYRAADNNARRAAASRLRAKANISKAINDILQKEHADNIELKTKIRRKYEKISDLTITEFLVFGAEPVDGSKFDQSFVVLKNMEQVNPEYIDCIKKIKQTNQGYEIELYSAMDAMAELRKMYGFDEPIKTINEHSGNVNMSFVDLVKAANDNK